MADPFESLRVPAAAVAPDPAFAARLRARIERALARPEGVIVSETTLESPRTTPGPARAASGIVPYLIVADARRAIDWYAAVFGARRLDEPIVMGDGRIGHASLGMGAAVLYLADETPESPVAAPDPTAPATVSLVVEVDDVDGAVRVGVDAGAVVERPIADHPHGRNAVLRDPFGHRWIVSSTTALDTTSPEQGGTLGQGDIGYVSLWVTDVERAATFFGHVLGWSYTPGGDAQGRQVDGGSPHHGLWGGHDRATLFACYAVDDLDEVLRRVEAAGGEAGDPTEEPYGRVATCVDDQGTAFAVFEPPPGVPPDVVTPHGARQGDIAYVTMEVADSARTRAFYGAVLGWRFAPGHVEDGWQVEGVRPMVGLHGGHGTPTTIPMYRVDDIVAAVARVREAGGSAPEPEVQPYGVTALCLDDQGTRFYLGQL